MDPAMKRDVKRSKALGALSQKEYLVNILLKELNVHQWSDRDKILLFKAMLYESLMNEYMNSNWIKVIERVIDKPWITITDKFDAIVVRERRKGNV